MTDIQFPLIQEFPYRDPCQLFSHFHHQPGAIFLDSSQRRPHCGQYSFIALDPFQVLSSKNGLLLKNDLPIEANPFEFLRQELNQFKQQTLADLPPFQGGAAGYLGYELAQHLERLPKAPKDEMEFPDMILGFYDLVLGFDLEQKRAWIFSSGFPALENAQRQRRAQERLQGCLQALAGLPQFVAQDLSLKSPVEITSNFCAQAYQEQVQKVINYILQGDIFEANISQRFRAKLPPTLSPFDLYQRLREINSAPFAAYLNFEDAIIASASPERFLKLNSGLVEARPIKGTRPRGGTSQQDQKLAQELQDSGKDKAENVMIVDLLRNDISRVCEPHSVKVPQLCGLETYPAVHHLVSVVTGKLKSGMQALDLLRAAFPGGSITGAPKLRAMEIIAELEPTQRGPYCGSLLYLGFDGNMDSSIIIRTFCIKNNIVDFQAGGAVVADSKPAEEYEEVLVKARALFNALGGWYDSAH